MFSQMVRFYTLHLNVVFVSAESKHGDRGGFETNKEKHGWRAAENPR